MNVILHKNDSGANTLTYVAKGYSVEEVQQEVGGIEITSQIEGFRHDFLNAYTIVNNNLSFDLEKARLIKVDFIRQERDIAFTDFDKRYEIALRDELDLSLLKQERQKLKDAPEKAEEYLNSCISIEEIEALKLVSLL
tara:strand:+ start:12679 stop:13092 length:414 start_codon:yes stop_codon:yes gene_type:complete